MNWASYVHAFAAVIGGACLTYVGLRLCDDVLYTRSRVDRIDNTTVRLVERVGHLNERVAGLQSRVGFLDEKIDTLGDKVGLLNTEIGRLNQQLQQNNAPILMRSQLGVDIPTASQK